MYIIIMTILHGFVLIDVLHILTIMLIIILYLVCLDVQMACLLIHLEEYACLL